MSDVAWAGGSGFGRGFRWRHPDQCESGCHDAARQLMTWQPKPKNAHPPTDPDRIPVIATHRGIGIHDCQTPARIKAVKAAIDRVARMSDILELADLAADTQQPPEARLFAASKLEVEYQVAAEERRNRPIIDLDVVRASVAGLNSVMWRSPWYFASLLDAAAGVPREEPLPDLE
jgi:hypothetical protein